MTEPTAFLTDLSGRVFAIAPKVAFVAAILVFGVAASALARRLVRGAVRHSGLEALAEGAGVSRLLYAIGAKQGFASALGSLAFGAGILGTLSAASDALGLTVVSNLTGVLLRYGPRLLSAAGLLVGTFALASFVQGLVRHFSAQRGDIQSPEGAAKIAYGFVVSVGAMLAAEQAGLEIRFLTSLLQIVVGLFGAAFALTSALGFYTVFRGMAAGHYYRPLLRVGDLVSIGTDEGVVSRFSPTSIVLTTPDGDRIVPNVRLLHHTVLIRNPPPRQSSEP